MKKIIITGANSYLGFNAANNLAQNTEIKVIALVSPRYTSLNFRPEIEILKADLAETLSDEIIKHLSSADCVFHFAWVRSKKLNEAKEINQKIIQNIFQHLTLTNRFCFISSVSGTPNTQSFYGKTKYNMAQYIVEQGGIALVLGLVMEDNPAKGPYKMLRNTLKKFPVKLRIGKGEPLVYPVNISFFYEKLKYITFHPLKTGWYKMFENEIPLNRFLYNIETEYNRKRFPIKLSGNFILSSLHFFKRVKLLPASISDKLLTFLYKDNSFLSKLSDVK